MADPRRKERTRAGPRRGQPLLPSGAARRQRTAWAATDGRYIDARETGRDNLIELILEKVGTARPVERTPRTPEERALLLATQPPGWEVLLFAATLLHGREALVLQYRDHELGYVSPSGLAVEEDDAALVLSRHFNEAQTILSNVERLLTPENSERAFGPIGASGDADRIIHLADRVIGVYRELLTWSARMRGAVVPSEYRRAFNLAARFVASPIRQVHEFVDVVVAQGDRLPASIRRGEPSPVKLTLVLSLDEGIEDEFQRELRRLLDKVDL